MSEGTGGPAPPPGPPQAPASGTSPGPADLPDAAQDALARARAVAAAKGLRPGRPGPRRRKDQPGGGAPASGDRDPRLLGDEIDTLVTGRGWRHEISVGAVIGRWPGIVGAEVAAHCHPIEFSDGILVVRAESTAWATQLRLLASTLLGRLTGEVGEGVVIEVRVVGPSAPTWSRGALRASHGRGPRDTYG